MIMIEEIKQRHKLETLLTLWEASVRATHHFLQEADILGLRPMVLLGLEQVPRLFTASNETEQVLGFMGLDGNMLEMLFLAPHACGMGLGRTMVQKALSEGVRRVDVNEQNPQALGFYLHMGFKSCGRSALDGQGRPFPLLHLVYEG